MFTCVETPHVERSERTRRRHLLAMGISKDDVKLASRSRKGYWRLYWGPVEQLVQVSRCAAVFSK
jgi:hypothetical protein